VSFITHGGGDRMTMICLCAAAPSITRCRDSMANCRPFIENDQKMTDAEVQELVVWLDDVRDDPVRFVEGAFEWGKGELENSHGPEPWQRWVDTA
jgi:hypothetical protein